MKVKFDKIIAPSSNPDPFFEDPQALITVHHHPKDYKTADLFEMPDAIYIPFYDRYDYLNDLLMALNWYPGQINIMTSNQTDIKKITVRNGNVSILEIPLFGDASKIESLRTFDRTKYPQDMGNWDLPKKRNYSLLHSLKNNYNKILLLDDDVMGVTRDIFLIGSKTLEVCHIVGC